ncbi:MAG TPA: ribonuclease P protein component [Pirellulaceae bacterium]|nr:ribonuclease P protein component [Pirellulaceae bacterium]
MSDQRFPKELRIRRQADFDRVYKARAYAADDVLVVNGCANGLDVPRLGLSVSRKVGSAVERNAWKRRIREAFRLARTTLPVGVDLVVRPQKGAACNFEAISRSLPALASRIARKLAAGPRGVEKEPRT